MQKPPLSALAPFALSAAILLAGCGKPTTITAGQPVDPQASQIAAAPPVKLPPALLSSKSYRCQDNSLVYVDFFNDGTTANIKTKKNGTPTALTAPAAGQPYVGDGYTVAGSATDKTIKITLPGKKEQPCNA